MKQLIKCLSLVTAFSICSGVFSVGTTKANAVITPNVQELLSHMSYKEQFALSELTSALHFESTEALIYEMLRNNNSYDSSNIYDLDCDGHISSADAQLVLNFIKGTKQYAYEYYELDGDADGKIDIYDAYAYLDCAMDILASLVSENYILYGKIHTQNSYTPQTLRFQKFSASNGTLISVDNHNYYDLAPAPLNSRNSVSNSSNSVTEEYSSEEARLQLCDSIISERDNPRIGSQTVLHYGVQTENVYPSGIVKILTKYGPNLNIGSYGSGCIVGKHVIATAAHVIYDKNDATSSNCAVKCENIVLFAQNGSEITTQSITPVEFHVPQGFISNQTSVDGYDFALITVEENLSDYISLDLGLPLLEYINSGAFVRNTGSPAQIGNLEFNNLSNLHNIATTEGSIDYFSSVIIGANCASAKSGSPLYVPDDNTLIGITVASGGSQYLASTAIRSEMFQFYYNNFKINY